MRPVTVSTLLGKMMWQPTPKVLEHATHLSARYEQLLTQAKEASTAKIRHPNPRFDDPDRELERIGPIVERFLELRPRSRVSFEQYGWRAQLRSPLTIAPYFGMLNGAVIAAGGLWPPITPSATIFGGAAILASVIYNAHCGKNGWTYVYPAMNRRPTITWTSEPRSDAMGKLAHEYAHHLFTPTIQCLEGSVRVLAAGLDEGIARAAQRHVGDVLAREQDDPRYRMNALTNTVHDLRAARRALKRGYPWMDRYAFGVLHVCMYQEDHGERSVSHLIEEIARTEPRIGLS